VNSFCEHTYFESLNLLIMDCPVFLDKSVQIAKTTCRGSVGVVVGNRPIPVAYIRWHALHECLPSALRYWNDSFLNPTSVRHLQTSSVLYGMMWQWTAPVKQIQPRS